MRGAIIPALLLLLPSVVWERPALSEALRAPDHTLQRRLEVFGARRRRWPRGRCLAGIRPSKSGLTILAGLVALLVAPAVSSRPDYSRVASEEEFRFVIDAKVKPRAQKPNLAALVGPNGSQVDFVANEILVVSSNEDAVRGLAKRWQGHVTSRVALGRLAKSKAPPVYEVRVTPTAADFRRLPQNLKRLKANPSGRFKISSKQGLQLLALAVEERMRGLRVGVNFVLRPATLRTRSTIEAPTDLSGLFGSNAFAWQGFSRNAPPQTGVGEAWNLLARAGRLPTAPGSRVPVAVLDVGFAPMGADLPPGSREAPTRPNPLPCGGSPCPFHGINVASALAALPDNGFGAAGPGGPVARLIEIDRRDNDLTTMLAVIEAFSSVLSGTRVWNMSFSVPIPAALYFLAAPADVALTEARRSVLLIASAGNTLPGTDRDVDARDLAWERTYFWPCESIAVYCVGGTGFGLRSIDPGSNFGTEAGGGTVDIYAPFHVAVGPDPLIGGNTIHRVQGTSFSSPFVAGVAALVMAANPSLDINQVQTILTQTAASGNGVVTRMVDALLAVTRALGPDLPPDISIVTPVEGAEYAFFPGLLTLRANATDREDGTPTVRWTIDGDSAPGGQPIPTGLATLFRITNLPLGVHTVRAEAIDGAGHRVPDSAGGVRFSVVTPTAPGP
jgi:serine protease